MKLFYSIILTFVFIIPAYTQGVQGIVYENKNGKNLPLPGVNIFWLNTYTGTVSNPDGTFEVNNPERFPAKLIVSFVGFKTDTVVVDNPTRITVIMKNSVDLKVVEISERIQSTSISSMTSINVETISSKELLKAACCNLAESFETNASVDVSYTDAVSGARQIQMLGLDGTYTQIMTENIPAIRGLTSSSGLGFIPGTWIESIQVTKGTGSVINGYESLTGAINVEFQKPLEADRVFVNTYANHRGRYELNVHLAHKLNDNWSTLLFTHGSTVNQRLDQDKNGFLDTPLLKQVNVFNRWQYTGKEKKVFAQFGVKALAEERTAGQVFFNPKTDYGTQNAYGIGIESRQFEAFSKTGLNSQARPFRSLGLISNFKHYKQESFFGLRNYSGEQNTVYLNLIYQDFIYTTDHKIKTGLSFLSDNYSESYNDSAFSRQEQVPGVFAEYNYDIENKYSILAGIRGDYHSMYGVFPTPRLHIKYHFMPKTYFRLSAGRGFRVANIFSENSAIMASSRSIHVGENLLPEIGWSYGASFTHHFSIVKKAITWNTDFFRTDFINQIVVDYDRNINQILFYNLQGKSYSNSFQTELIIEAIENLEFKSAYKWYDVKTTYNEELLSKPLVSGHRVLLNATYYSKFDKWKFDATAKWYGSTRIPGEHSSNTEFHLPERSQSYWIFLAQITRSFKKMDIYLGGENLSNFMQHNPIIAPQDPFGPDFDASLVWGPLMGRVIYAGIRVKIK
ncbi:MAG: TonB-dependent receptor [Bacteroidetes bacterium]|nr:TonB-dependent receptor [Bacteroidota bacterium]HET6245616.1 TonB-dependent receptor [Bacteroidia bacterium]